MAYPETIPGFTEEEWHEFLIRLDNFKLTEEQREFYRGVS